MRGIFEETGKTVLTITLGFALILWNGVAVSYLWLWFIVPVGMPAISFLHSAGIYVLVRMLNPNVIKDGLSAESFVVSASLVLSALLFGFVISFGV